MLVYPLTLQSTGEPWCPAARGVTQAHRKRDYPVVAALLARLGQVNLIDPKGDMGFCTYHQSPGGITHLTVPAAAFGGKPAHKVERIKPAVTFVWGPADQAALSAHAGIGYAAAPVCLGSAKGQPGGVTRYDTHLEEAADKAVDDALRLLTNICPARLRRWKAVLIPRHAAVAFLLSLNGRRTATRMPGERRVNQMMAGLMTAGGDGPVSALALARVYGRVVQDKTSPLGGLFQLRMLAELIEEDYGPAKGRKRAAA